MIVRVIKVAVKCDECGDVASAADDQQRAVIFAHMNGWKIGKTQLCPKCAMKPPKRRKGRAA
jgi:hypothetical protein